MPFAEVVLVVSAGVTDRSAVVTGVVDTPSSCLIVDVEVDLLLNPLVKGARCVSFNFFVNFQDIVLFGCLCVDSTKFCR